MDLSLNVNLKRVKDPKLEEFKVPEKVSVFEDKRTSAKTLAMPFQFSDGKNGVLMIAKLTKFGWNPSDDIESITVKYK
jgi:hypothetical protein